MSRLPRKSRAGQLVGDAFRLSQEDVAVETTLPEERVQLSSGHHPSVVWEARSGQCRIVRWADPSSGSWYVSPEINDGTDLMGQRRWKRVNLYYNQLPSDLVGMVGDLTVATREMTRGLIDAMSQPDMPDDTVVQ